MNRLRSTLSIPGLLIDSLWGRKMKRSMAAAMAMTSQGDGASDGEAEVRDPNETKVVKDENNSEADFEESKSENSSLQNVQMTQVVMEGKGDEEVRLTPRVGTPITLTPRSEQAKDKTCRDNCPGCIALFPERKEARPLLKGMAEPTEKDIVYVHSQGITITTSNKPLEVAEYSQDDLKKFQHEIGHILELNGIAGNHTTVSDLHTNDFGDSVKPSLYTDDKQTMSLVSHWQSIPNNVSRDVRNALTMYAGEQTAPEDVIAYGQFYWAFTYYLNDNLQAMIKAKYWESESNYADLFRVVMGLLQDGQPEQTCGSK